MLDKNGERQLAYVVQIDDITPIKGYDRVELAHVGGWTIVVGKGEFKVGDPAIYFEIDSKLPEVEPFTNMEFLVKKHYKIKTQKMCKSLSQGLLMSAANFGWEALVNINEDPNCVAIKTPNDKFYYNTDDSRFLTQKLNITYATESDNKRKAKTVDKYKSMVQRHPDLFSKKIPQWFMKREWGKKLMFLLFGKKEDKKRDWPYWVQKTDEERIENLPHLFTNKEKWIVTEKIDGTSTTFTLKRGSFGYKELFLVCSRNVVFNKPEKNCYYDTNVYIEMAEKYNIYNIMKELLNTKFKNCDWITIQGETYGAGIQQREYGLSGHDFVAFNLITSKDGRLNSLTMKQILDEYNIPSVPILNDSFYLPDTIDELRRYVDNTKSKIDNEMREGIVCRSQDGTRSFKCVSPSYLIKYHS